MKIHLSLFVKTEKGDSMSVVVIPSYCIISIMAIVLVILIALVIGSNINKRNKP